jgi:hypothetical protein
METATTIVQILIALLIIATILGVITGIVFAIFAITDNDKKSRRKKLWIMGSVILGPIVGLFLLLSLWGFLRILTGTFAAENYSSWTSCTSARHRLTVKAPPEYVIKSNPSIYGSSNDDVSKIGCEDKFIWIKRTGGAQLAIYRATSDQVSHLENEPVVKTFVTDQGKKVVWRVSTEGLDDEPVDPYPVLIFENENLVVEGYTFPERDIERIVKAIQVN